MAQTTYIIGDMFEVIFPMQNLYYALSQQYNENKMKINVSWLGSLIKP